MVKNQTKTAKLVASKPVVRLAVVLIRGLVKARWDMKATLQLLHLTRPNRCIVVAGTPAIKGMLHKIKDFITWGPISEEVFQELLQKRGVEFQGLTTDRKEKYSYRFLEADGKKYLPYFGLHPPRKGFERKGIKVSFNVGGALGYRGDNINQLLSKMM